MIFIHSISLIGLYLVALISNPILCYYYKLGKFPKYFKYLDSYEATHMELNNLQFNSFKVRTRLGQQGSIILNRANKTYLGRLIYTTVRHPLDYYKKRVILGKTKL